MFTDRQYEPSLMNSIARAASTAKGKTAPLRRRRLSDSIANPLKMHDDAVQLARIEHDPNCHR